MSFAIGDKCPKCGSGNVQATTVMTDQCGDCGHSWTVTVPSSGAIWPATASSSAPPPSAGSIQAAIKAMQNSLTNGLLGIHAPTPGAWGGHAILVDQEEAAAMFPPALAECSACKAELSDYLDAYYGKDPQLAAMCAKCRFVAERT